MISNDSKNKKVVFISSITSDIGIALANRYQSEGYIVTGTYRSTNLLHKLSDIPNDNLYYCDLLNKESIYASIKQFSLNGLKWDIYISCAAIPTPMTRFFDSDFEEFNESIHVNSIEQLRYLHAIHPYRNDKSIVDIIFFGGPGTNSAVTNFSPLTVSKIMLLKMCELIDIEYDDVNIFIIGPGWTMTKAHDRILNDKNVPRDKYLETLNFIKTGNGTSMDDIYDCINWLCEKGRSVAGGRNFSVVHDLWGTKELEHVLKEDIHMYKTRRFRNDWNDKEKKQDD